MASYLQIENISKSFGPKVLFDNIAFNINEGDKISLIAPNGTGKTSLLRILAGKDKSDSVGKITFLRQIRVAFLEQNYSFDPDATVSEQIMSDSADILATLDDTDRKVFERNAIKTTSEFGLHPDARMSELSGGEVKRVALTSILSRAADFLILDEPTNHLDTEAIEYLENYLTRSRCTLLMVTHDRYFLDRVCNIVMELDGGSLYVYKGDYENYLEKRSERISNFNSQTEKIRNIFRRELEWIHASPCARSGKAKYRKEAFVEIKKRAEQSYVTRQVSLEDFGQSNRLGTKIIDCKDVCRSYDGVCYLSHFTYNFQRFDKVGIVGRNGVGKSTFLNLLTGDEQPESGVIERGDSLVVGYYRQVGIQFDENQTVMETVPDTHLLENFLFPHDMWNNRISKLSGGEKRRLYLLTILMKRPNLLILDEPTNDLDIVTLDILEEYLISFEGSLIIVSHDRHFLDRIVSHLFVFCGDGVVKDFIGGYTEYREYIKDYESRQKGLTKPNNARLGADKAIGKAVKSKLTYKEKLELQQIEKDLAELEKEKSDVESVLSSGNESDYRKIQEASERFEELKLRIDSLESRWLELSEYL